MEYCFLIVIQFKKDTFRHIQNKVKVSHENLANTELILSIYCKILEANPIPLVSFFSFPKIFKQKTKNIKKVF